MAYDVPPPEQCPEPRYYYHYKHDPNGPLDSHAGIVNLAARGMPHAKHTLLAFLKSQSQSESPALSRMGLLLALRKHRTC